MLARERDQVGPGRSGFKIKGARIWITGASSGIGQALAIELARCGACVGLTSRREEQLQEVADQVTAAGGQAFLLPGDVTDRAAMKKIAGKFRDAAGGLDVLIANAGTHRFTEPQQFDVDAYMHLMELNFGGVLNCMDAVLPIMRAQGQGHIVGVASLAGYRALPRAAAYGASKAALIHFLESTRFHLEHESIDVTVVNPGFVRTPLTDKNDFHMPFLMDADRAARTIRIGIERGKKEITFPCPFNWTIKLLRIIPMPLYIRIMQAIWKRTRND